MLLYSVSDKGTLTKVSKVNFAENRVFIVDDYKTIYIWFGLKVPKKKKDLTIKKSKILNEKRKNSAKVQILNQKEEYGAFLAMMDILKKGLRRDAPIEKRTELKIKYDQTLEFMEAGINPDFEAEITMAAHSLSEEKKTYENLCKQLARIQLSLLKGKSKVSENDLKKRMKEIQKSSSTYDEICWLIAELQILIKNKYV